MAMKKITLPPEQRAAILRRAQSRPHRLRRTAGRAVLAAVLVVLLTFFGVRCRQSCAAGSAAARAWRLYRAEPAHHRRGR